MMAPNNEHPDEKGNAENNNEALEQGPETVTTVTDQPMELCVQ